MELQQLIILTALVNVTAERDELIERNKALWKRSGNQAARIVDLLGQIEAQRVK